MDLVPLKKTQPASGSRAQFEQLADVPPERAAVRIRAYVGSDINQIMSDYGSCRIRSTKDGQKRVSRFWIRHNPSDDKKASGSSHGLNWAVLDSRAISISSAFSSPSLTADVGVKRLVDQPGQGTRPRKQRFYHDLLLADPEDRVPRTA
jgi:hypothetical protein